MTGSEIRLGRLFGGRCRRTFIIAYDHGLTSDAVRPAGPPGSALERIVGCEPDGVLLSAGLLRRFGHLFATRGAPAAIVRTDWMLLGGDIPAYGERYRVVTTPAQAAALGADAVIMIMAMGLADGELFAENAAAVAAAAHEASQAGIPLIVETTLWGARLSDATRDPGLLAYACRIAQELGADMIKTEYTGDPESMAEIVASCGVPVVTLGGPKSDDVDGLLEATSAALGAGVRGVAYGRNVWLSAEPFKVAARLRQVVHGT